MAHLIQNKLCLFLKLEIAGEINCFTVVYLLLEFCLWKRNILIYLQLITLYGLKELHRHKTEAGVGDMAE